MTNKWNELAINHFDREHLSKEKNRKAGMWPNKSGQIIRFDALRGIDNLGNKKIIDVGCGLGDFYFYLKENKVLNINYTGIELHPEIVKLANHKYPNLNIKCGDILNFKYEKNHFDYAFASGLFNFALDDWYFRTETIMKHLFHISKYGISLNFLRWREADKNDKSAYVKIDMLYNLITELTNNFIIRGDYKKNDFTVYLYKNQLK